MFWNNFYNLCIEKGMKPLQVVKEIGIAHGSITKWKNGAMPNTKNLQKIADYFEVSVEHLLEKEEAATASAAELGKIIRELRGNMSLRDFAKKCNTTHTTIDNLEKGFDFRTGKPTQVKMVTLQKIADACGVSLSYLTGEIPIAPASPIDNNKKELFDRIDQMTDEQIQELKVLVKYIIDNKNDK